MKVAFARPGQVAQPNVRMVALVVPMIFMALQAFVWVDLSWIRSSCRLSTVGRTVGQRVQPAGFACADTILRC